MPFLDHLEELRWRILWSGIAIIVGSVIGFCFVYYLDIIEHLIAPIRAVYGSEEGWSLIYLSPADPFFITLKLAVLVGVILAFPVVVQQFWVFLAPALEAHEKKAIIPAFYLGFVLFCAGVAMAYFVALPISLVFFQNFEGGFLTGALEVNNTLAFVTKMLVAFGAVFELPVVVMVLSALGLVTPAFLRSKRRHAIVAITILASFITPGDAVTLTIAMIVPLFFLYEFGIILSAMIYRRRKAREALESSSEPPDGAVEAG